MNIGLSDALLILSNAAVLGYFGGTIKQELRNFRYQIAQTNATVDKAVTSISEALTNHSARIGALEAVYELELANRARGPADRR